MSLIYRRVGSNNWPLVPDGDKLQYRVGSNNWDPAVAAYRRRGPNDWQKIWDGDTSAPSGGLPSASWNGTGFTVNYTAISDPSGIADVTLYWGLFNGTMSSTTIYNGGATSLAAGSVNVAHKGRPTQSSPNTGFHYFYISKTDGLGNHINTNGVYYWAKPSGDWYFTPNGTLNSGYGTWRVDNTPDWRTDVSSSIFGTGSFSQYAYGFYNTDFYGNQTTYSTGVTKGYTPDSGEVEVYDNNNTGTGGTFNFSTHAYKTHPGTGTAPNTTTANTFSIGPIYYGYGGAASLPSGALSAMTSQSGGWGLFMFDSSNYRDTGRPGVTGTYNNRTWYAWRLKISYT